MSEPRRTLRIIGSADEFAPLTDNRDETLLTAQQVAVRLNCSAATVYELVRRGGLPAIRFQGTTLLRFSGRALDALIARGGTQESR